MLTRRLWPPRWRFLVLIGGGLATLLGLIVVAALRRDPAGNGTSASLGWSVVHGLVRQRFPDVPALSTAELDTLLTTPGQPRPRLLDVREAAEYEVSHLDGAERLPPDGNIGADTDGGEGLPVPGWPKDTPIVTYCSVGYRSAAAARRLREAGYTNVRNLRGSIFAWANEGRPLVNAQGAPTTLVHPYDAFWGVLVDPKARWNPKLDEGGEKSANAGR